MDKLPATPDPDHFVESVTVVTGAGSGIGRALSLTLARLGAIVVCTDIDADAMERTRIEVEVAGGTACGMPLDVTSTDDYAAVRDLCLQRWGRVDRVINNAGVVALGLPEHLPLESWQRTIDVNVLGLVRSNEVFLPVFLDQGSGQLVNVASTSGLFPYSYDRLAYVASKAAVVSMTESLALYLRPQGIDVRCVAPAGVRTGMPDRMTRYGPQQPIGAPALPVVDPDEFAEHVVSELAADTFLICSVPEAYEALARRGGDVDANLAAAVRDYGYRAPSATTGT